MGQVIGAAVGMAAGLSILAMLVWKFPAMRQNLLSDGQGVSIAVAAVLGGWAGYWLFGALFGQ